MKQAIYDLLVAIRQRLEDARVHVRLECETDLTVRTSRGYLMQAMIIVIVNALDAMSEARTADPRLAIQVVADIEAYGIMIANNGPAIPAEYRKLIFEPSFSIRQAGRGLGLHVARDLLAICNCSLELVEDASLLVGPCFRIRFDGRKVM